MHLIMQQKSNECLIEHGLDQEYVLESQGDLIDRVDYKIGPIYIAYWAQVHPTPI